MVQAYIKQLEENPMRTKMLTSGTLSGAQEFIASWLAKDRNKNGHYFTSRVPKMAAYGAFVSAPLASLLIWLLQKVFAGRTSLRAKILQILASNLIVSPDYLKHLLHEAINSANYSSRLRPFKTPCTSLPWPLSLVRERTIKCGLLFVWASGKSCA